MDARDLDMLGMNLAEVGTEPTNIVKNCNDKSSGSDDYSYKSAEIGTDCISRKAAIEALRQDPMGGLNYERILGSLPSAQCALTCDGCRHVGTYDTDFPCNVCIRREKDYYEQE